MSGKLIKSTSIVGSMTLVSRISGLVRDVVFANLLGDRAAADVFFVAFRIPNFFRRITAEGAFSAAFVPVFTDFREHREPQDTDRFLQLVIGRFGLILLIMSIVGVLLAPLMVQMLAWGFVSDPEKFALTVDATRITFPYLFFISLVAMSAGMLNTCGRFAAPAATPVLLNICLIFAAIVLAPMFSEAPIALAVGVLLAGLVQLAFQLPFLRQEGLSIRPRVRRRNDDKSADDGVKQVFKLMIPAIFGGSVSQLNVLINTLLASFMATGSISWLYYSDRLMEFPVGVFGIALSTVILPDLSKKHAQRSHQAFARTLDWGARWVCLICIPATVALAVLAVPLIATIFFHGDFTANGVHMSAYSLIAYSLGLLPIVLVKVLAPGYFARKDTRTPVRIGVIAVIVNIVVSLILFYPMQHVGLALATSIAAVVNASLLYSGLKKEKVLELQPGWLGLLGKILLASAGMGGLLWWGAGDPVFWLEQSVWQRILRLSIWIPIGAVSYFLILYVFGLRVKSFRLERTVE
ncbi:MAG: murein biosynthesis integral membrane protein MurJ [bacterium]